MPLCKHTHSCLSGPSIWHKEETQGHRSHLSVWHYSDIRHHEAALLETGSVRISRIPHHTKLSRCWQYGSHGKASPSASWADTQTKAWVALWQRGSPCQIQCDEPESCLIRSTVDLHSLAILLSSKPQTVHLKENSPMFQISSSYPKSNIALLSVFPLILEKHGYSEGGINQL